MKAIGLTGGIASGKSTVCDILKEQGVSVISADELAHQAICKGTVLYGQIVRQFGPGILAATGEIDRKKLGEIVFADPGLRKKLEQLIHPVVIGEMEKIIETGRSSQIPLMVFEIPLLFETGMESNFDEVWVISVLSATQEERLKKRNNLTAAEVKERIAAQLPLNIKEGKADRIIYNNGGIDETRVQVDRILRDFGELNCTRD